MASLPLTWSSAPPTEPGYYWFRSPASAPTLVLVRPDDAEIALMGEPWTVDFLEDGAAEQRCVPGVDEWWAGPLQPPAD
jgi:hypothetical protein